MKAKITTIAVMGALFALIIYGGTRWPAGPSGQITAREAVKTSSTWHPAARRLVALMVDKYGPPSIVSDDRVVWGPRGPGHWR